MSTLIETPPVKHKREVIDRAVIRFAGDSGDGMQITGSQFTNTVALYGNDIATFPDFPAEIRAPAGKIRKSGDIVAVERHGIGELASGNLHAVTGVTGKADDRAINDFAFMFYRRRFNQS